MIPSPMFERRLVRDSIDEMARYCSSLIGVVSLEKFQANLREIVRSISLTDIYESTRRNRDLYRVGVSVLL
jgi:hypothetical protein